MNRLERNIESIKCECGGFAQRVTCTPEEVATQGCGRSWECCIAAFVCCLCNKRTVRNLHSPEMESF